MPMLRFALLLLGSALLSFAQAQPATLFVGTYTADGSHGIYVLQFNTATGALTLVDSMASSNPSYLAFHAGSQRLYAVNENGGEQPGMLSTFLRNASTGRWERMSEVPTGGDHPCYVSVNKGANHVLAANYSGGSLAAFPLDFMGMPGTPLLMQHTGRSVNEARQTAPHVHTAIFSPDEQYVLTADLGTDEVVVYPYKAGSAEGIDTAHRIRNKLSPGAGPRHLVFHPRLSVLYVMEELSGKVSVHRFYKGKLSPLQSILADRISVQPGSADIHISPDGRFLYCSNRADANNIAVFDVQAGSGKLSYSNQQSSGGLRPRNFCIDPSGRYLLVANQGSHHIVVYRINTATGLPEPLGQELAIPSPVCLLFAQLR